MIGNGRVHSEYRSTEWEAIHGIQLHQKETAFHYHEHEKHKHLLNQITILHKIHCMSSQLFSVLCQKIK